MPLRRLPILAAAAFLLGALLYGTPISLLHLASNRVTEPARVLGIFAFFHLLYGLAFAAVVVAGGGLYELVRRWRLGAQTDDDPAPIRRPLVWGAALFHLTFWFFAASYGLTYDELPLGGHSLPAMVGWLALRGLGVLLVVAVASLLTAAALRWLAGQRRVAAAALSALALSLGGHFLLALVLPRSEASVPRPASMLQASLTAANPRYHLIVIGVDGADWRVAAPLIAAGRLPNLAALVAEGTRASLESIPDSNSAVIWASIYTGQQPAEHQVGDFYRLRAPGLGSPGLFPVHRTYAKEMVAALTRIGLGGLSTVTRADSKRPLLWEVADQANLSLALVDGYFYSFPALRPRNPESKVFAYGLDWFAQTQTDPNGEPARREELGLYVQPVEAFPIAKPYLSQPDWEWQSHTFLDLLRGGPQPQLMSLYTHEPDTVQHQTWRGMEPQWYLHVRAADRAALGPQIPAFYESLDRFLGEVRQRMAPDTVLMVVSDHGHAPSLLHSMDTQHRHGPPGILLLYGPPVRRGLTLSAASVFDIFPTALYLLDLPIPEDDAGEVLVDAFEPELIRGQVQRQVPTYWGAINGPALGTAKSEAMNAQEIQKLISLGYLN